MSQADINRRRRAVGAGAGYGEENERISSRTRATCAFSINDDCASIEI